MAHAWITAVPELRRLRQREAKFQTSIGYRTRHVKKRQSKPKRTRNTQAVDIAPLCLGLCHMVAGGRMMNRMPLCHQPSA